MPMHESQLEVCAEVAARLIADQFPELAAMPIRAVDTSATVNKVFRVGERLTARFPLIGDDPGQVRDVLTSEAAAVGEFAGVSPVPSPEPVALGEPGPGYPLAWCVQTWVPGSDATVIDPAGSIRFAVDLAALLTRLRAVDTAGRSFSGNGRGGHLPDHDEWLERCFTESEGLLDVPRLRAMWDELRTLPSVDDDVMCHGDLIPPNVLVHEGRLAGVLDTGGFGAADPAVDLVAVWHLLDARQREIVRAKLRCTRMQWRRGMAWAFQQAMGLVWYYAQSNPVMSRWGRRTLNRLVAAWPD